MKKLFTLLCIGLLFTACAQQTKNETEMEFTDNVKVALADSGIKLFIILFDIIS